MTKTVNNQPKIDVSRETKQEKTLKNLRTNCQRNHFTQLLFHLFNTDSFISPFYISIFCLNFYQIYTNYGCFSLDFVVFAAVTSDYLQFFLFFFIFSCFFAFFLCFQHKAYFYTLFLIVFLCFYVNYYIIIPVFAVSFSFFAIFIVYIVLKIQNIAKIDPKNASRVIYSFVFGDFAYIRSKKCETWFLDLKNIEQNA